MATSRSQLAVAMAAEAVGEAMEREADVDVAEWTQPVGVAELMGSVAEMVRPCLEHADCVRR
jgi:hypothetical protein